MKRAQAHGHEKEMTMATTPRRPSNPKDAAEALFKPAKKAAAKKRAAKSKRVVKKARKASKTVAKKAAKK